MIICEIGGKCQYGDCPEKATQIACDPGGVVDVYCDDHAEKISSEGQPVTVADCPNCHCAFGVWP